MSQYRVTSSSMNIMQRTAAETPVVSPAPITVIGGTGTGKTETCLGRVLHLLESGVDARHIAYLTPAPRMAAKFREMLEGLPPEQSRPVQSMFVGTPEQYAVFYLRGTGAETLHIPREFSLWDRAQAVEVISETWGRGVGEERLDPAVINEILDWYALDQAMARRRQVPLQDQLWRRVLDRYAREKRAQHALDIADVKPWSIRAMDQRPDIQRVFAGERTLHLLVDGMQDLTPVDRALLDRMVREDGSLLVTWDPNQGITLPVRGDIQSPWPTPDAWKRESRHVLRLIHGATKPLAEAGRRLAASPAMTGLSDYRQGELRVRGGSPPIIRRFSTSNGADAFLLRELTNLHDAETGWSGAAVICRDPADVPRVRLLLESRNIPCEAWGVREPPDQDARRVVNLIASVLNPLDSHAFAGAAFDEDARRGIVVRHVTEQLNAAVRAQHVDLFQAARQQLVNFRPNGMVHTGLDRMIRARARLDLFNGERTLEELCRTAMALVEVSRDSPSPGLSRLLGLSRSLPRRMGIAPRDRAVELLNRVNADLYPGALSRAEGVIVTTPEEARGLEWPNVFVLDADVPQEGRSPEEEQRLRYIALTRGTHQLYYLVALDRSNRVFPYPWQVADLLEHPDADPDTGRDSPVPGEDEGRPGGSSTGIR